MPFPREQYYTVNDILNMPDGERAELINNQIYNMAPPSRVHQKYVTFFTKVISNHIDKNDGQCEIYPAPFGVFIDDGDSSVEKYKNYVEPDISVICDKGKLKDDGCHGAPDWIIEIVSPSSRRLDYYQKLALYQKNGVREYWIIDPDKEVAVVYVLENDTPPTVYRILDKIKVSIYSDLQIDLSQIQ